jgi:hypothetical protein
MRTAAPAGRRASRVSSASGLKERLRGLDHLRRREASLLGADLVGSRGAIPIDTDGEPSIDTRAVTTFGSTCSWQAFGCTRNCSMQDTAPPRRQNAVLLELLVPRRITFGAPPVASASPEAPWCNADAGAITTRMASSMPSATWSACQPHDSERLPTSSVNESFAGPSSVTSFEAYRQVSGERRSLHHDAFHHLAIADEAVREVPDDGVAVPIEACGERALKSPVGIGDRLRLSGPRRVRHRGARRRTREHLGRKRLRGCTPTPPSSGLP